MTQAIIKKNGVEKILYGTEFYNALVSYYLENGTIVNTDKKYSELIWDGAIYSGVSPYHIASRIKQEVGPFKTHNSISGKVSGYEGLYNFYNIGATSDPDYMQVIKNGLQYAKDAKGGSQSLKENYLIPWNTPQRAITGGAVFIGSSYINVGQNTLYLQKFDVNDDRSNNLFWHQYMTNCLAPYNEASSIQKAYQSNGMLSTSIGFVIPIYNNMPEIPVASPNILDSDFKADDTKVYADVSTTLNIRSGPGTSYESLIMIDRNQVLTRIGKGIQSGEQWDKIQLPNGMIGYGFASYIKEVPEPTIESIELSIDNTTINKDSVANITIKITPEEAKNIEINWNSSNSDIVTVDNGVIRGISTGKATISASSKDGSISDSIEITVYTPVKEILISKESMELQVGKTSKLTANILPEDSTNKTITWLSSNPDIASVDQNGLVTAKIIGEVDIIAKAEEIQAKCKVSIKGEIEGVELEFNESLTIEADEISGLDLSKNTVTDLLELINTNLNPIIYNSKGEIIENETLVGTGCKLVLENEEKEEIYSYTFVVYGDVNGDGGINALDSLVIQRHILETKLISGIFLKSGNISKNGSLPTALDVLKIQRHILETKLIDQ